MKSLSTASKSTWRVVKESSKPTGVQRLLGIRTSTG